jgi:hypothetical protein
MIVGSGVYERWDEIKRTDTIRTVIKLTGDEVAPRKGGEDKTGNKQQKIAEHAHPSER